MKIGLLIFDFDGVIVDSESEKRNAWTTLLQTVSDPHGFIWKSHDIEALINNAHATWIDGTAKGSRYDIIEHMMDASLYPKSKESIQWYADMFGQLVEESVIEKGVSAETASVLETLSRTYPLYLNSATPEDALLLIAKRLHIDSLFKGIYGKTNEKRADSKKQNILIASSQENVSPEFALFIGDSESDYRAAREAECEFIRYKEFSFGREKAWSPEAPRSIQSMSELTTYLV